MALTTTDVSVRDVCAEERGLSRLKVDHVEEEDTQRTDVGGVLLVEGDDEVAQALLRVGELARLVALDELAHSVRVRLLRCIHDGREDSLERLLLLVGGRAIVRFSSRLCHLCL